MNQVSVTLDKIQLNFKIPELFICYKVLEIKNA
jgi:hypothetical protein